MKKNLKKIIKKHAVAAYEAPKRMFPEPLDISPDDSVYYEFKVSLKYISPLIWRRIRVSGDATMWELANAILDAMGWGKYHLYGFRFSGRRPIDTTHIGFPSMDMSWFHEENKMRLFVDEYVAQWFAPKQRERAILDYDYGDGWEHEVVFERIVSKEKGVSYPQCVKGKRACPPDDCGGIGGYEQLIEIVKRGPKTEEEQDIFEWYLEMNGLDEREKDMMPTWEEFDVFDPGEIIFSTRAELKKDWKEVLANMCV